jgi:hypothetical protein
MPAKNNPSIAPTLIVHPDGIAWVVSSSESANGLVKGILDRGGVVMGIDAFQTGSAKVPRNSSGQGFFLANGRRSLAPDTSFTWFNQTDDANRVQDILTALAYLQDHSRAQTVNLVGLDMAGVWTYFARSVAGKGVNLTADLAQFRTDSDQEYIDKFFIPGLRKAGDFRAAAALNTEGKLLLHNVSPDFPADWVKESAQADGSTGADVRTARATEGELLRWVTPEAALRW